MQLVVIWQGRMVCFPEKGPTVGLSALSRGSGLVLYSPEWTSSFGRSYDPLTSVANRRVLRLVEASCYQNGRVSVLFVDLDRFKVVNDELGHSVGDAVLRVVAQRVQGAVRENDVVVRYGGDEFIVICKDLTEGETAGLAGRIEDTLREPVLIDGVELSISASLGSDIGTVPANSLAALIANADQACYKAKAKRRLPPKAVA